LNRKSLASADPSQEQMRIIVRRPGLWRFKCADRPDMSVCLPSLM